MGKILFLYLSKKCLKSSLIILFSLVGIIWLSRIIHYVDLVTVKGMKILDFLLIALLLIPSLLQLLLPFSLFIGTIVTLNIIYNNRELFILKSSGLSRLKIIQPILLLCMAFTVICMLMTSFITPYSYKSFNHITNNFKSNLLISLFEKETLNNIGDDIMVYVGEKYQNNVLENIIIYENLDEETPSLIIAKNAKLFRKNRKSILMLEDGNRFINNKERNIITQLSFKNYGTDLNFYEEEDNSYRLEKFVPKEVYITELIQKAKSIESDRDRNRARSEMHYRIIWPIFCLMLPFIAYVILLGGEYNRNGLRKRNIIATLMILLIVTIIFYLKSQIISGNSPLLLYLFICFIFAYFIILNKFNQIKLLISK